MPELPEVETIKNSLKSNLINKIIKEVNILEKKQFIGKKEDVIGRKIVSIDRYGKILSFKLYKLDELSNFIYLNIHLKMTGEVLYAQNKNKAVYKFEIPRSSSNQLPNQHTRIIITFTDNSAIFFNDLRKFGWIKITEKPEMPKGVDVLSNDFTPELVYSLTRKTSKPIKLFLIDQDKITGIGNIYANDSLWIAKINPKRKTQSLSKKEVVTLYQSILKIISEAIQYQGSSGADEMYVMPDAQKGRYQYYFKVYQQENKPCLRCKTKIERIKQGSRSSFFCPNCQK